MAIVTISRGTFAGGERVALLLGERLGYRVVSRELLYERVQAKYGVAIEQLAELMERAPNIFDRSARQGRRLLVALQAAFCELVSEDSAVYHGQSGHLFLPGVSHVVRVRLIAPRAKRIEMATQREGITEYQASLKIDQVDAERMRWSLFFYGLQWGDPAIYDLTLNLERLSVEDAAEAVARVAGLPTFATTEASRQRLQDLTLQSSIKAQLMAESSIGLGDLDVEVVAGQVRIVGGVGDRLLFDLVERVRRLPGVARVEAIPARREPT
jgi:cytidylate kinase